MSTNPDGRSIPRDLPPGRFPKGLTGEAMERSYGGGSLQSTTDEIVKNRGFGTRFPAADASAVKVLKHIYRFDDTDFYKPVVIASSLLSFPPTSMVIAVCIKHDTAWQGGTATAVTVDIGTATNDTYFINAFDIYAAPTDGSLAYITKAWVEARVGDTDIQVKITVTGDFLDNLTQGDLSLWVLYAPLS